MRSKGPTKFIAAQIANDKGGEIDKRIDNALDFLRTWAVHRFPHALVALERIQVEVFNANGMTPGAYSHYAAEVEHLMLPASVVALDEYGIPLQIAEKIADRVRSTGGLDDALEDIKGLTLRTTGLTPFERAIVEDARSTF